MNQMKSIHERIRNLSALNGLDMTHKYIYENQILLDQIDYESAIYRDFFKMNSDKYTMSFMFHGFRKMNEHISKVLPFPTAELISDGNRIFIRRCSRYIPDPEYFHEDAMEVMFILREKIALSVNQSEIHMKGGDICFIAPNSCHHLFVNEDQVRIYSILVYVDALKEILGNTDFKNNIFSDFFGSVLYGRTFLLFLFCDSCADDLILELLLDVIEEQEAESIHNSKYMQMVIGVILLRMLKNHSDRITSGNTILKNNLRITAVIDYARNHYKDVTLAELVRKFNYSKSNLSTLIKSCYGNSFSEIITDIKLEKSLELLKNTDLPIADISEDLGYADKSYFFHIFKKKFLMTPGAYRKQIQDKTGKKGNKNMRKGIIFDLDGVITYTDEYHYEAWKALADSLSIPFDREVNNRLRGISRMASLEIVLEKSEKQYTQEEKEAFCESKNNHYRELLKNMSSADLEEDTKRTLEELRNRGYLLAIGSSSKNAKTILERIGLGSFFDKISDGTNITHSKPDPEVFLKAAQMLGLEPAECLVVEDAVSGAEAAHRAGMECACVGDASKAGAGDYNLTEFKELLNM